MAVLLTGGAGFIGSHVLDRLVAQQQRVVVIDAFNTAYNPRIKRHNIQPHLDNPLVTLVEADLADPATLPRVFEQHSIELVIHLAARAGVRSSLQDPLEFERSNGMATTQLLDVARKAKVKRVVMASSSSVYGNSTRIPFTEEDPCHECISPYAATKRSNELMAWTFWHLYQLPVTCLRFFTVYGPRQRPDMGIHIFTRLIRQGKEVTMFGDGSMSRDFTYIDDIVAGVLAATTAPTGYEIINLGNTHTIMLRELIELVGQACGVEAKIKRLPEQPGDVQRTWADISKARRLLGYQPTTPIAAGVKRFVTWYDANREWLEQKG